MTKEVKTLSVTYDEFISLDKFPSKFYFKDGMGDFVFIYLKDRKLAKEWLDKEYGRGHYTLRCSGLDDMPERLSARG